MPRSNTGKRRPNQGGTATEPGSHALGPRTIRLVPRPALRNGGWGDEEYDKTGEVSGGALGGRASKGGVDTALWLNPRQKCSINGTPKILPTLTPGPRR